MLIPTVNELPLHLAPTGADPRPGRRPERLRTRRARELDHRCANGIEVRLTWNPSTEQVLLDVSDGRTGDAFSVEVEPADALEAFHHPYSYAAVKHAA